jgi:phosphoenolpyruvate synthase/pyruvate phosphate dikinase
VPVLWFEYAKEEEILSLLDGKKPNIRKVISRAKFYSEISEAEKFQELSPNSLNKLLKNVVLKEKILETNILTGQVAYIGKIAGKAKIILSPKDIGKVKKSDILVAVYTDPNLLPAMEKAAAFVTEQGGITSHAAIVAREMRKPCVIGTKIATKVFKDGDMVEVDANRGIVRKIAN